MVRMLVVASVLVLALCAATPASSQESGVAVRPVPTEPLPALEPRIEPRTMAAILVDYPLSALRGREEGTVKLSMCVNEKGNPRDIRLVQSSGSEALDRASLKSAKEARLRPGRSADGKTVDWCNPPYVLTITWRLPPK